jgi:DNA-binding LytR/AlgR family response regulator
MNNVKVQIVEDDESYSLELEMMILDLGYNVLPPARTPEDIKEDNDADLVITDIYFDGKAKGLELAQALQSTGTPVIVLTSQPSAEVYRDSRGILTAGFAVKPIAPLSLQSIMEKALILDKNPIALNEALEDWNRKQIINQFIFVRHGGALVKLTVAKISHIDADGNYCYIFESDRRYAVKSSLKNLKELLKNQGFLQINRSQLANFRLVEQIDFANSFAIVRETKLAIGKTFRREVEAWLNKI